MRRPIFSCGMKTQPFFLYFHFAVYLLLSSFCFHISGNSSVSFNPKQAKKMSNPSSDESGKEPNIGNDPPKGEVNDDLPAEDPKNSEEEESQDPSPEEEELMKKKYGGLVKKKPPLISKDHERAFFDSADWALGKPTPHQQLRTRLSASSLTEAGEDGSNNGLDQLDEQSGTPAADGENK
ncbi:uncharacterized protein LOC132067937 isoform X4 [Lycium ferocissimum]|uniref:uncharacterized protein LOC132067937 isoform X4 n=1 Tax=Lycium ferocissimum TaxID=112874 RepID=UPI00281527C2|nr:uncharacterized protein LOC132067937 isoform X4 [Lycium ferocissimum]